MGTFAETAIVDYHLPFADQEKQTSVFSFHLQPTNWSLPCPFAVWRKQTEVPVIGLIPFSVCGIPETWRHGHGDMEMEKWKHGDIDMRHDRLPTKENKLLFSVSICSQQIDVCHFRLLFEANKWKFLFFV
jgi:hypothetical protein